MKLGILTDLYGHYKLYEEGCKELDIDYVIIDFLSTDWLSNIQKNLDCNGFLVRPTHDYQEHNDVYMERLYFLTFDLKKQIYPSYNELRLYENKRNMATWLELYDFTHAKTNVFLNKKEAMKYVSHATYPLVIKSNIGAGATGVKIVKSTRKAKRIINNTFGRFHPFFSLGQVQKRKRFGMTIPIWGSAEKHVVLIQDYHEIQWEWRIIKINDSYFGHKKLLKGEFASGSDRVEWIQPPEELLEMTREICEKGNFYSMAVDIFETTDNTYIVNELQSLFGSYLDSQMNINGIPGRYRYLNNEYVFEEGTFNQYGSYLLRVEHFIQILNETRDINE